MENEKIIKAIIDGKTALGIELGSTRIKAVLADESHRPIAAGNYDWENQYVDRIWTYDTEDIWKGVQESYRTLKEDVKQKYGVRLETLGAIGFSGMMHGYMVFDEQEELLTPFRTWRNTITEQASVELTEQFHYNIPQRWSIAHLYQAILNEEAHVPDIRFQTTLAGYIHWKLTGQKVLGVGEASGMFPIDPATGRFDEKMIRRFNELTASHGYAWKLEEILPAVLQAGVQAGTLTEEGAGLLDVGGHLRAGIPFCPPEGDAGTGMTATNSVAVRTGNVSAGTSVFAMLVLEKELSGVYPEIDLVTTPNGHPVAMVHCNNCTSDLNAWVDLFQEFAESMGMKADRTTLFETLYQKALEGDKDCGGLLAYNYFSGEHITGFEAGRPLFVRTPESRFDLANFMRTHLFTSMGALKTGMDILFQKEQVKVEEIFGHGGLFKTKGVGQRFMAAAMNSPVSVMQTAGEGGAWGMALLAAYMLWKKEETLGDYLAEQVFAGETGTREYPDPEDVRGFDVFMERYTRGLSIERAAVDYLQERA